jgi:hypothetical protein
MSMVVSRVSIRNKVLIGILVAMAIAAAVWVASRIIVPVSTRTPSLVPNARTYSNAEQRFSVTYDSDAVTVRGTTMELPTRSVVAVLHFKHALGGVWFISGLAHRNVDDAYLRKLLATEVRSYGPHAHLGTIDPAVLGSLHGFETGGVVGKSLQYLTFAVGRGRYAYVISAQTQPAAWHSLQSTIMQIVRSFAYTG